jgi:hypothetical protein
MAYLRKEHDIAEFAYPVSKVWKAIPEVLSVLGWTLEELNERDHCVKARTPSSRLSWGSTLFIEVKPLNANSTMVTVLAESVVTTVTAIVDFGRARRRVSLFFEQLSKVVK